MQAREGALKVLYQIDVKEAYSSIAIGDEINNGSYSTLEKGLMTELVYGVLENMLLLDYIIEQFSSVRLKKLHPWTLNILRLGVYQLRFLDKVPESAAVNEAVNLAKKYCVKSSGFVNGVLRSIVREKERICLPDPDKDRIKYLSVKYSHPEWMVKSFLSFYSYGFVEELLKANNETPQLYVRVNTLKISVEDCVKLMKLQGYSAEVSPHIHEAVCLKGNINLGEMELMKKGYIYVQDFSSMLIARILDPKAGDVVVDVCSAPGGKATHMAQLMDNQGIIIARDIYEHKLRLIRRNAENLGVSIIKTEKFDALEEDRELFEKADRVLVDAPCSGLGIIRKKPEIKYRKKPDDIIALTELQLKILKNAANYVKSGGYLVYSTCTIDPRENEGVIQRFLKERTDFQLIDAGKEYSSQLPGEHKDRTIQLFPNVHNTDGFFAAKLIKN
jgi:16S rRNA (cytosine967-C5)-methyltransferase